MISKLHRSKITVPSSKISEVTFLCVVGAQKAGTSWLHAQFSKSDLVHVPDIKEMHYFDSLYGPGAGDFPSLWSKKRYSILQDLKYKPDDPELLGKLVDIEERLAILEGDQAYWSRLTRGYSGQPVIADITPAYSIIGRDGFSKILQMDPNVKILFILRDPLSRIWSAARMQANERGVDPSNILEMLLNGRQAAMRLRSDYINTVSALDDIIPSEQLMYIFYEEMFTHKTIERLSIFLNIPEFKVNFDMKVRQGQSYEMEPDLENRMRDFLAPQYRAMAERFGEQLPDTWRS